MSSGIENHVDHKNKVISLLRTDSASGKKIYALVNVSHRELTDYSFGVEGAQTFRVAFDGDSTEWGGAGRLAQALPKDDLTTVARPLTQVSPSG